MRINISLCSMQVVHIDIMVVFMNLTRYYSIVRWPSLEPSSVVQYQKLTVFQGTTIRKVKIVDFLLIAKFLASPDNYASVSNCCFQKNNNCNFAYGSRIQQYQLTVLYRFTRSSWPKRVLIAMVHCNRKKQISMLVIVINTAIGFSV